MGKWTALKSKYPTAPLDQEYQAKVDVIKQPVLAYTDEEVKGLYVIARHRKSAIEAELSVVNAEIEAYEQIFIERFEARGTQNQKFEDGVTIYLSDSPTFKTSLEFFEMVKRDPVLQHEFPLTVNAATLKARLKERLENNQALPPGVEIGWIDTSLGCRGLPKK